MDFNQGVENVSAEAIISGVRSGCNFLVHSDGGVRSGSAASSAWVVTGCFYDAASNKWHRETWATYGFALPSNVSSFLAEAIALEAALEVIVGILTRLGNTMM